MSTFNSMTDMELTDDEKLDEDFSRPIKNEFPWGLRITLTHKELGKLGLDLDDAVVGDFFTGSFVARITSLSSCEGEDRGKTSRLEAQIEKLSIHGDELDEEEDE